MILSRDGWLKRVREMKDLSATRLREGDVVLDGRAGLDQGAAGDLLELRHCLRHARHEVPQSTGYGEPVQKLFNFKDGERVSGAMVVSEKACKPGTLALAVTKAGYGLRFSIDPHREPSTRSGRRFAKVGEEDELLGVQAALPKAILAVVTAHGHSLLCKAEEVSELAGPGRGVTVIKVEKDDEVVGFALGDRDSDTIVVAETEGGKKSRWAPGTTRW